MHAELISIGDEILIGQITNTNSQWLAQQLNLNGISVAHMCTVSDERQPILDALDAASNRAQLVFITGGLGPTRDDITKQVLADFFGTPLVENEEILNDVRAHFEKRGRKMNELGLSQAMVPEGCRLIRNSRGTAPGMWFERGSTLFFSLPGVPYEMKPMVTEVILPELRARFRLPALVHRTVLTIGIGESDLAKLIAGWEDELRASGLKLAYLPQPGQVRLRISGLSDDGATLQARIAGEVEKLKQIAGRFIYGEETIDAPSGVIGILTGLLKARNQTLSLAESCTGGYLAAQITAEPGASTIFRGAIVPYTNTAKHYLLEVPKEVFERHGAVSEECVVHLARNVMERFESDYSISISGIAGPTGGTKEKPVGTVWIAVAGRDRVVARKFRFVTDRQHNIAMSANAAANLLRQLILGEL